MRIEIYMDKAKEFRWRIVADNGNKIADSGEGYSTQSNARRAVRRLKWNILKAKTSII